ncbi:putative hexose carrier protein [Rhexocercosporidium sp. MPI-PUGE-AT-0058]|nr:putative hexose carrier protein [Rhexocercosporidium sp. MPI-PUGE-AT-0058]
MNSYVLLIALVVATGGFVFGVDSGIIATTLGHKTFAVYMYGPSAKNASLTGAIVSLYNAGQALGTFITGYSADRFSRRWTICAAGMLATFGAALQTAAQNVGMMIAGRFVAGLACGMILAVVPVYIAEVSPPKNRGLIVGLQGMMISIGFMVANWIGYAGGYASGNAQWRIPLAMQMPGAILLSIGCFFIPYTPRWLVGKERHDEAKAVIIRLHDDQTEEFLAQEFRQIHDQILLENEGRNTGVISSVGKLFSKQYFRRTATACFILMMGQLSGSTVIQNYQSIFYAAVGYTGRTGLLISGIYGFMGVFGQIAYLAFVADKWMRTRTLWIGSGFLCVMISIIMALSAEFGTGTTDQSGPRAAISFIFIYSFGYALFFNAMVWVVPVELFPFFLRSKGLGLAVFSKAVVAIILAQITPIAIENVHWRYYSLFIASNFVAGLIYYFFLPETKGKSLEEIAELFGDALATEQLGDIDTSRKEGYHVSKHIETA